MIRAIIFDFGGVLLRTHDHHYRHSWEKRLGLEEYESENIVFGSEMGTKAQIGEITNEDLWGWVGQRLDLSVDDLVTFRRDFWAGDVLDKDLIDYIRSLRSGYKIAMISNASDSLRQTLSALSIDDGFDLIVCSAEEKIMKPNEEIFERTLGRLGCGAAEAIFVDDSEANIQAAKKMGMATVHFRPSTDVPNEFAELGVSGGNSD